MVSSMPIDIRVESITSSAQTTLRWATFGVVAADGDIPVGQIPQLYDLTNPSNPMLVAQQQIDHEATWPSGTIKRATIHALITYDKAGTGTTYRVIPTAGTANHTPGITPANIISGTPWDVEWTLDENGATYKAGARQAFIDNNTIYNRANTQVMGVWCSGPYVVEWILRCPFKNINTAANHPMLQAFFHVRAYKYGANIVTRTDAFVEGRDIGSLQNGDYVFDNIYLRQNGAVVWQRLATTSATVSVTPSAASGANYTAPVQLTASAPIFTSEHRGRVFQGAGCRAYIGSANQTATTLTAFPGTFLNSYLNGTNFTSGQTITFTSTVDGIGHCVNSNQLYPRGTGQSRIAFTCTSCGAGAYIAMTGTDLTGTTVSENVTLVSGGSVLCANDYQVVTSLTVQGNSVTGLQIGHGIFANVNSIPGGSWKIFGQHLPNGSRLRQRVWSDGTQKPNVHVAHDVSKLFASYVLRNWAPQTVTTDFSARLATFTSSLNAIPSVTSYPGIGVNNANWDTATADYNPFFSDSPNSGRFDFVFNENTTGGRMELGLLNQWEMLWLRGDSKTQTVEGWRNVIERTERSNAWPFWYRDENTGLIVNLNNTAPANRTLLSVNYDQQSQPIFFPSASDGGNANFGFSFVYLLDPASHAGSCNFLGWCLTGDFWQLEALQADSVTRALTVKPQSSGSPLPNGTGLDRLPIYGVQIRGFGRYWKLWCHHVIAYPDGTDTGGLYDKVMLPKTLLKGHFTNAFETLYQHFTSPGGLDQYGITPEQKGDLHWVVATTGLWSDWQNWIIHGSIGWLVEGQLITSANALAFAQWFLSTPVNFYAATGSHSVKDAAYTYFGVKLVSDAGTLLIPSIAALWTASRAVPDGSPVDGTNLISNANAVQGSTWANATLSQSGVGAATIVTDAPVFYAENAVGGSNASQIFEIAGGFIKTNSGRATITSVTDSMHATVNITNAFPSTTLAAPNWGLQMAAPGANTSGVLKQWAGQAPFTNDYREMWYAALASASSISSLNASATQAQADVERWLSATGSFANPQPDTLCRFIKVRPSAATQLCFDNFSRLTNNQDIAASPVPNSSSIGASWTRNSLAQVLGDGSSRLKIASNVAFSVINIGRSDYKITTGVYWPVETPTQLYSRFSLITRLNDASSADMTAYYAFFDWNASLVRLYRVDSSGNRTELANTAAPTVVASQTYTASLLVSGSNPVNLTFTWQGATLLTYSDSSAARVQTRQYAGIGNLPDWGNGDDVRFSNFTVTSS